MQLIIISGLSGSGKTIALGALEDAGFYCVDNLPIPLIAPLIEYCRTEKVNDVAVVTDSRDMLNFRKLPETIVHIQNEGVQTKLILLDARDEILLRRFSETRRKHPLASSETTLAEAIVKERHLIAPLSKYAYRLDTSELTPNAFRGWIKSLVDIPAHASLTLTFESFGFSRGIPLDADFVFDVRFLDNPHHVPELRHFTGCDKPVADFLEGSPTFNDVYNSIRNFIALWLPAIEKENRSSLTVAIGCTGGKHRSVYMVEKLADAFKERHLVLTRHRTLNSQTWRG